MKTAIQFLLDEIAKYDVQIIKMPYTYNTICEMAFKIEKDQIIQAWENGALPAFIKEHKCSRDYFEQTYKNHQDETF